VAISPKPKAPQAQEARAGVDVEALINKGLAIRKDEPKKAEISVLLRLQANIAERLDFAIKAKPIRTPRHSWILEAILEKLEREGQ
jgi:hypothetical protein